MATYYKYKERGKEDRVDWSKITSEVSKRLRDITADKEKYKKDIEDASAEYIKGLDNRPVGENENENARIAAFSEQAQNFELENLRKLKRGEIKSRDYLQGRNNLNSDTDLLFKISKEYQEVYSDKVKRQQGSTDANGNPIPPEASAIEAEAFAEAGRFANPNKAGYDVDPITGTVRVSFLGSDGRPDLTKSQTLRQVQGMVLNKYNRYNGDANADAIAKGIGEDLRVVMEGTKYKGGVKTRADAFGALMKNEEKTKALEDQIKASWGTTLGRASFLIDNVNSDSEGNAYTVKFFDSEKDVAEWKKKGEGQLNTLVMVPDEENPGRQKALLTKEQEEYSMQKMKDRIKLRLDVKETARTVMQPPKPSAAETRLAGATKKNIRMGEEVRDALATTDPKTLEKKLGIIIEYAPNLSKFKKVGKNKFTFEKTDENGNRSLEKIEFGEDGIYDNVKSTLLKLKGRDITNIDEVMAGISFERKDGTPYTVSDLTGKYAPIELRDVLDVDEPTNQYPSTGPDGSVVVKSVKGTLDNIDEVNEDVTEDVAEVLRHQLGDKNVNVTYEEVTVGDLVKKATDVKGVSALGLNAATWMADKLGVGTLTSALKIEVPGLREEAIYISPDSKEVEEAGGVSKYIKQVIQELTEVVQQSQEIDAFDTDENRSGGAENTATGEGGNNREGGAGGTNTKKKTPVSNN